MNTSLWDRVKHPPTDVLKDFKRAGGFAGTGINPYWAFEKATELFGPVGIGWGFGIEDEKYVEGGPILNEAGEKLCNEIVHVVRVRLWYNWEGQKGEVVQFGQTKYVEKQSRGVVTDDEAPKKSVTDALSKCLSLLGFGAAIYQKQWDGHKYLDSPGGSQTAPETPPRESRRKQAVMSEQERTSELDNGKKWMVEVSKATTPNRLQTLKTALDQQVTFSAETHETLSAAILGKMRELREQTK